MADVRMIDANALKVKVNDLFLEWTKWMDSGAEYDELDFDLYSCLLNIIDEMPTIEKGTNVNLKNDVHCDIIPKNEVLPFEEEEKRQKVKLVRSLVARGWRRLDVCNELRISEREYYKLLRGE